MRIRVPHHTAAEQAEELWGRSTIGREIVVSVIRVRIFTAGTFVLHDIRCGGRLYLSRWVEEHQTNAVNVPSIRVFSSGCNPNPICQRRCYGRCSESSNGVPSHNNFHSHLLNTEQCNR